MFINKRMREDYNKGVDFLLADNVAFIYLKDSFI